MFIKYFGVTPFPVIFQSCINNKLLCYRWKGENVSTAEVEGVVSNIAGYRDCVVYGVEV